jgi:hypothetical protein
MMQNLSTYFINNTKLPKGTVLTRRLIDDPKQEYFLYIPRKGCKGNYVFITVHGVKRMAKEHADEFAPFAEHYGLVLLAPLFPKERFCDYQRLGHNGKSVRADLALNRIIEEVGFLTGADTDKLLMFGYSGGGQFVHRYGMAYPQNIKRIVVAAPGWYTFPDYKYNYPLGLKKTRGLLNLTFDPTRFLSIPSCVMVGEKDVHRDAELNKSKLVDHQQGLNRLERGKAWVRAMKIAASDRNLETEFNFQMLPGCNHSFLKCMRKGKMGQRVFKFLLGSL